jgi:hypothetical protein
MYSCLATFVILEALTIQLLVKLETNLWY